MIRLKSCDSSMMNCFSGLPFLERIPGTVNVIHDSFKVKSLTSLLLRQCSVTSGQGCLSMTGVELKCLWC